MVLVQRLHLQFEVFSAFLNWPLGVSRGISSPRSWLGTSCTLASASREVPSASQPPGDGLCRCSAIMAFLGNVVSLPKMPFLVLSHHIPPATKWHEISLSSTLLKTHCTLARMEGIFFSSTSNRHFVLHSLNYTACSPSVKLKKKFSFKNDSLSFCLQLLSVPCCSFFKSCHSRRFRVPRVRLHGTLCNTYLSKIWAVRSWGWKEASIKTVTVAFLEAATFPFVSWVVACEYSIGVVALSFTEVVVVVVV